MGKLSNVNRWLRTAAVIGIVAAAAAAVLVADKLSTVYRYLCTFRLNTVNPALANLRSAVATLRKRDNFRLYLGAFAINGVGVVAVAVIAVVAAPQIAGGAVAAKAAAPGPVAPLLADATGGQDAAKAPDASHDPIQNTSPAKDAPTKNPAAKRDSAPAKNAPAPAKKDAASARQAPAKKPRVKKAPAPVRKAAPAPAKKAPARPPADPVDRWISKASAILAQHGTHLSAGDIDAVKLIIEHESGGDPRAVNNWDSNAAAGHPSMGLMQTIPSTFDAYALGGKNRHILNPVANIIAGVRYAISRYGSLANVPGVEGTRTGTGYVGY